MPDYSIRETDLSGGQIAALLELDLDDVHKMRTDPAYGSKAAGRAVLLHASAKAQASAMPAPLPQDQIAECLPLGDHRDEGFPMFMTRTL